MEKEYSDEETFQKKKYIQINENEGDIAIDIVNNERAKNKISLSSKNFEYFNKKY